MRKHWQRVLGIAAVLFFGVAANVAVAWICVWRYPLTGAVLRAPADATETWFWPPPRDLPVTDVTERRGFGVRFREVYHMHNPSLESYAGRRVTVQGQQLFQAGWPLRSLRWTDSYDGGGAKRLTPLFSAGRVSLVSWERGVLVMGAGTAPGRGVVWLPVMPSGLGFVGNTLLYATAAWLAARLAVRVPRGVRRRRRLRLGCCRGCGYPVGELARCPECGREIGGVGGHAARGAGAQSGAEPPYASSSIGERELEQDRSGSGHVR